MNLLLQFFSISQNQTSWDIFQCLLQSKEPLPVHIIAEVTEKDFRNVSRVLQKYHQGGFLIRQQHSHRVLYSVNDDVFAKISNELGAMREYRRKLDDEKKAEEAPQQCMDCGAEITGYHVCPGRPGESEF